MRSYIPLLASLLTANAVLADESVERAQLMQRAVMIEQNPDRIRALVKAGFDINDPIGCGTFSSLDGAVTKENPALVELLLSLGAKPRDRQLVSAALAQDHAAALKMVRLLQAAGISVNAREYYSNKQDMFSTALHKAVWRENVELVRYLLSEGAQVNELSYGEQTSLMVAVEKRNTDIFDLLLAAGADPAVADLHGRNAVAVADAVIATDQSMREKMLKRLAETEHAR